MKPIITEDEIKKFAKDECIKIINRTELFYPMANMEIFPESNIDGEWHYEENRKDGFRTIKVNRYE